MSSADLVSFAVKEGRRGGADDVAAVCMRENMKMIRFSNNRVTVTQAWLSSILSVMVAIRKRVAIGSVEDLSRGSVKQSLKDLIRIAESTGPNKDYAGLPRGQFKYRASEPSLPSPEGSTLVDHVKVTVESAVSNGAERVAGALVFRRVDTEIETSAGASGSDASSSLEISVRAFCDGEASGQANSCARREEDFHPEEAGRAAAEIARRAVNPVEGKPGRYNVVLGPNVFANLLNDVMTAASAFNVEAGLSFMADKLGGKVASSSLTLVDDGTTPEGLNSRLFDDEGVPSGRTVVIDRGVIQSYLHNFSTAKKFRCSTTGNAGWIVPQPWNIIVEPGRVSEEVLLQDLGEGVYITNNWYTRFQDYRRGDFSTVCRDGLFRVEGGEIVQSLKGLRISGNLQRILRNIVELSDRRYWVKWWEVETPTLTPHVLVRDVTLTKAT